MSAWLVVAFVAGAVLGGGLAFWMQQRQLKGERDATDLLRESFRALAAESLHSNSEQFLKLAEENLKKFQSEARSELDLKEKSIETLVKPINEALKKTSEQIEALDRERRQTHGSISQYLQSMHETQLQLQGETRNLVNALRKPEVRGRYGEMSLKRLAELAGMVEHCDFTEQTTTADGLRPDMIVRMPDDRELVIDAKTPINAYLDALEAADDAARDAHLVRHVQHIRSQVQKLAAKSYWGQFKRSPDFVVMFLPGEQFLEPALKLAPDLHEEALRQKVVIATPTSLVALLKVVAITTFWRSASSCRSGASFSAGSRNCSPGRNITTKSGLRLNWPQYDFAASFCTCVRMCCTWRARCASRAASSVASSASRYALIGVFASITSSRSSGMRTIMSGRRPSAVVDCSVKSQCSTMPASSASRFSDISP